MAENLGNAEEQIEVITEGMTEDVTDKKCPNCGATVVYDPETLSMSCPFCGYSRQLPKPEDNGQDVEESWMRQILHSAALTAVPHR